MTTQDHYRALADSGLSAIMIEPRQLINLTHDLRRR
jgi:hypothetical protein